MKHYKALTVSLAILFFAATFTNGASFESPKLQFKYSIVESNLLVGAKSNNFGLRVDCAYKLGEIKSKKAVNCLMSMLRNSNSEEEQIMAALSLRKIENARGLYALKRAAKFAKSDRVKRMCKIFYYDYLQKKDA